MIRRLSSTDFKLASALLHKHSVLVIIVLIRNQGPITKEFTLK